MCGNELENDLNKLCTEHTLQTVLMTMMINCEENFSLKQLNRTPCKSRNPPEYETYSGKFS